MNDKKEFLKELSEFCIEKGFFLCLCDGYGIVSPITITGTDSYYGGNLHWKETFLHYEIDEDGEVSEELHYEDDKND